MKILYHHRTRGHGAEGAHIMGIVNAFRELGHDVKLLSLPGSDPEEQKDNNKVSLEKNKTLLHKIIHKTLELTKYVPEFIFEFIEVIYNLVAFFRVGREIDKNRPVFLYERYSLFMFAGVLQARRKGVPVILEVNDSAIVERVRPLFFRLIASKIEKWIFTKCSGIVFISSNFKNTVEQYYGEVAPSVICPNAADSKQFSMVGFDREKEKEKLGLSSKVVCGYVGAFHHWHGIEWFVRELAPKIKKHPQLSLLLVGDGPVYDSICSIISSHKIEAQVVMPGRVPHSEVKNYIAAMDYGILPDSNEYGSPMKLFEMMAMRVPLVSPSFEPIVEVVTDKENGWLFSPNNRDEAVNLTLNLSNDLSEIHKVGLQAEEYIKTQRLWIHNAESVFNLLHSLSQTGFAKSNKV